MVINLLLTFKFEKILSFKKLFQFRKCMIMLKISSSKITNVTCQKHCVKL